MQKLAYFTLILWVLSMPLWATPWLGLSFQSVPLDSGKIALDIKGVHPESGARVAGLLPGDRVIAIENQPLTSIDGVKRRLGISHEGQQLRLTVLRGKKKLMIPVKLTERPDDISVLTGSVLGSRASQLSKHFYANADVRKTQPAATLVDFWATWCGPCRKTMPIVEDLYNRLGPKGLEVIGVSTEALNVLNDFQKKQKAAYPLYRDADQFQSRRYGIQAIPTILLLDYQGYIQRVYQGVPSAAQLERDVRAVMNASPALRGDSK